MTASEEGGVAPVDRWIEANVKIPLEPYPLPLSELAERCLLFWKHSNHLEVRIKGERVIHSSEPGAFQLRYSRVTSTWALGSDETEMDDVNPQSSPEVDEKGWCVPGSAPFKGLFGHELSLAEWTEFLFPQAVHGLRNMLPLASLTLYNARYLRFHIPPTTHDYGVDYLIDLHADCGLFYSYYLDDGYIAWQFETTEVRHLPYVDTKWAVYQRNSDGELQLVHDIDQ